MKAASDVCLQALDAAFLMRREKYMQNTELLLKKLTLEEKCALLSGAETFKTRGMPEHGIPQIWLSDGPHGLRKQAGESDHLGLNPSVPATCFPTASAVANSWDAALGEKIGAALGEEAAAQEVSVVLGPGLNMKRNPLCGRSFEYFSEDPYLAGKLAAGYIRGIQSKGVAACPKHFACNNQEFMRNMTDSRVSERALREIYLKGFEICVKEAHPKNIMTSYNKVNSVYSHYNYDLCTTILREEWGYTGNVMTDWWMKPSKSPEFPNLRDQAYRIRAQVDLLMPGGERITNRKPDGTLLKTYGLPGGITLGEIQRSAKNVLTSVLNIEKSEK